MGRKIRIEFEEVAGYPQEGTIHVWVDGEEIKDIVPKMDFLVMAKNL